ncbi:two component transcriptional regulator, Fis family [Rhodopirellula baltica SWK14]|uniref:Two component transcriptional regulator, Fis family n=1 Tax=Rhodopirellula baltica SWK14 TaxID=993516 RepID=L7CNA4_RHOBT|nr:two component transcriptional regulator, Fis family [Rhodopirellula baltica SWK14]
MDEAGAIGQSLKAATRLFQIAYIEKVLTEKKGNMTEAAQRLGVHRTNLYRKLKQLGINVPADGDCTSDSQ